MLFGSEYFTYIVVAGEHNLKEKDGFEQESNIAEFIVHPGYSEVGVGAESFPETRDADAVDFIAASAAASTKM